MTTQTLQTKNESHKNIKLDGKRPMMPQVYTKIYRELLKAGNMKGGHVILAESHSNGSEKKYQSRFSLHLSEG